MWHPMQVAAICETLGAVARRRELAQHGVDGRAVRRAVASGAIVRIRSGVYALPGLPAPTRTALRHGGVLACVSVARQRGLWVLPIDGLVHVALAPHGHAHPHADCTCVQHWNELGPSRTEVTLVDALLQMRGCVGEDAFFAALESALHQRILTPLGRAELRDRITESARWLVELARSDAESGLESLLRLRLHRLGLELHAQVQVPGVGRVDFVIGDRLILEVDGRDGHDDEPSRHKDRVRDAVAAAHGFDTIRFDYDLVVHEWHLVEQAILAKVARDLHLEPWSERLRSA
ncbi:type IV toxin-antitoxin system AbiEi family antitoxin domain-containing protein [Agromyces aurantiacus]|uniref:Type IV toxin-antitoxin system AbiEi family antitoxin domain-containing protein n=1 Tax=Agromyces aurantiacus TaxID=165814 RepID=A0ABV9R871_9MICO|nr:type IV toxin-antitoxin system AbiEi family antitoxin domain-containing protein [Agromyces aurantiacus]MBM7504463.1 very-short-patch-repair endonuclease [Agromyces aurantiacus]